MGFIQTRPSIKCFSCKTLPLLDQLDSTIAFLNKIKSIRMSSSTSAALDGAVNADDLKSFHEHLGKSSRVLALLGAGLSASSGIY